MLGQQRPLVRVLGQHLHGGGQLIAGGVGTGVEQDGDEVDQLVVGEPVAVVFGANELGDQVVAERPAAASDQAPEVGVELFPRPQNGGLVGCDVGSRRLY